MSGLNNKYYVIYYDFGKWNMAHPYGKTLEEASLFEKETYFDKKSNIIHEMWLDCLEDWPEPEF